MSLCSKLCKVCVNNKTQGVHALLLLQLLDISPQRVKWQLNATCEDCIYFTELLTALKKGNYIGIEYGWNKYISYTKIMLSQEISTITMIIKLPKKVN